MHNELYPWIALFAVLGLFISAYIFFKKRKSERLVCPVGADCELVTHSEFSSFWGVGLEVWGLAYYGLMLAVYGAFMLLPGLASAYAVFLVLGVSITAFLFSLYLIGIQGFVLREWCTWCLGSAGVSTAILAVSVYASDFTFLQLLAENRPLIVLGHAFAAAVGLGTATVTDVLFFRFLRDFRISRFEDGILKILSQTIWVALGLIVLTGLGLFLPDPAAHLANPKFLLKTTVVAVLILNGFVLNLAVAPHLRRMAFAGPDSPSHPRLAFLRRLAFAGGALSIVSWYTAFLLGSLDQAFLTYPELLAIYGLVAVAAIAVSQVVAYRFRHAAP